MIVPVQGGAPLAVVVEGEVGAVGPLLPAQLCTLGGDARGWSSDPAPPRSQVYGSELGLLEGEDDVIAGAPGAHLHFVGGVGVPLLLLTLAS